MAPGTASSSMPTRQEHFDMYRRIDDFARPAQNLVQSSRLNPPISRATPRGCVGLPNPPNFFSCYCLGSTDSAYGTGLDCNSRSTLTLWAFIPDITCRTLPDVSITTRSTVPSYDLWSSDIVSKPRALTMPLKTPLSS